MKLRTWQLRRLAEWLAPKPLRRATRADLERYLAEGNWSSATRHGIQATMRDFYRELHDAGEIIGNPAGQLRTIRVKTRAQLPAPDAVIANAAVPDARAQLMIDLAAHQGLRRGEIAVIHSRDLHREDAGTGWTLVVHGKGSKDRLIPLHDDIAERIRDAGPGWLFPSRWPGQPLKAGQVGLIISAALGPGWSAHSLRRRFATAVYDGGRDLRAVQELLGHASLATTQRYIGTRPESLRDAPGLQRTPLDS